MLDIVQTRRNNLSALVRQHGLTPVANRMGKPARQISDIVSGRKSFGEKVARDMELAWDSQRPRGWLDQPGIQPPVASMATVRRSNLRRLIERQFRGSKSRFAAAAGISMSQLAQWLSDEGALHSRNLSETSARKLEQKAGLEPGWLDQHDGDIVRSPGGGASNPCASEPGFGDVHLIKPFEASVDIDLPTLHDSIDHWSVRESWLMSHVRDHSAWNNLRLVSAFDDAMCPHFDAGDPLLVDIGQTSVQRDSVFFFRIGRHAYVRRIQRIPDAAGFSLRAIAQNDGYEPFNIESGMDFEVLGRVLKAWRSLNF